MPTSRYELITRSRHGHERVEHGYASDEELSEGDLITLRGGCWIIDRVEEQRAIAEPARYRLDLRYEDGSDEAGVFRRFRANGRVRKVDL